MYSYEKFARSRWSLVITTDGAVVFKSQASAIKPLIRFLKSGARHGGKVVIYDKYVGRAAALLIVLIRPGMVHTPIISEGGREVLERFQIAHRAGKQVKYLMGIASDDMCRWEKMTIGKSPREFWDLLRGL